MKKTCRLTLRFSQKRNIDYMYLHCHNSQFLNHILQKNILENIQEPDVKTIQGFLAHIFREERLDAEVAIMSLVLLFLSMKLLSQFSLFMLRLILKG